MEEIVHPIFLVLPLNLLSMSIGQHKRKMLDAFNVEMPSYLINEVKQESMSFFFKSESIFSRLRAPASSECALV